MELSAFVPKDTLELVITSPKDGKPTDVVFVLAGPAHPARQTAYRAIADAYAAAAQGGDADLEVAKREELNTAFLAGCVVGWSGLSEKGKAVKFSAKKASEILMDDRFIGIRHQVAAAVGDNKLFFE